MQILFQILSSLYHYGDDSQQLNVPQVRAKREEVLCRVHKRKVIEWACMCVLREVVPREDQVKGSPPLGS